MPAARRSLRSFTPAKATTANDSDGAEAVQAATSTNNVPTSSSSSTTYATTTPARQRRKRMTEAEQLLSASDAGESDIEQHMHADHALTRSHHKHLHSHSKLDTIAEDSDDSHHNTRSQHLSVPTPATTTKGRSRLSKKLEPISEASQSEDDSHSQMSRAERLAAREARRKRTSVDRKSLTKQATPPTTPTQKLQISVDEEPAHADNKTSTPHADQFLANLTSEFTSAADAEGDAAEQSPSDEQSDEEMHAESDGQVEAVDAVSGSDDASEEELIDDEEPVSGSDIDVSEAATTTTSKSIADLLSRAEALPQAAAQQADVESSDDSDAEPEAESLTATKQHVVEDDAARQQQLSSQRSKADERREQRAKVIRQRQDAADAKQKQLAEAKLNKRAKASKAVDDAKAAEADDDLLPDEVLEAVDKLESQRAANNITGGSKVERAMRKLASNQLNDDSDDDDDIGIDDLMAASKQLKQHKRKARRGKKKSKGMRIDPTIVKSKRSFDDLYEYTRPAEGGVTVAVQPSYQNDQRLFIDDYLSTQVAYVPPKILQHQYRVQYNDSIRRAPPKKNFKQLIGRPNAQFVVR